MATRTISPLGGNYNALATWVEGAIPTTADDVVATALSGNLTINVASSCKSFDMTSYVGTLTHNSAITFTCVGSFTLVPGMTYTKVASQTIQFTGTGTYTITTAGKTMPALNINGTGSWTLQDNWTANGTNSVTITKGTFDTGNFNISCGTFVSTASNTRVITLGSSTITLVGNGTQININDVSLTFNYGTSTFVLGGSNLSTKTININSPTIYNLTINAAGANQRLCYSTNVLTIAGTLTVGAGNLLKFSAGFVVTVNLVVFNSTAPSNIYIVSDDPLVTAVSLVGNGGTYNFSYLQIEDSNASGGTWNASNSIDNGNNTGWNITAPITGNAMNIAGD